MRRSSSTQNSVSLFPFLAVLICTMGALVLLLLGLTQSMRTQAAARLSPAASSEAEAPRLPLASIRPPAPPLPGDFDHESLSALRSTVESQRETHWRGVLARAVAERDAVREELARRQARRAQLEADLQKLTAQLDVEAGKVNAARVAVEVAVDQEQELTEQHTRLSQQIALTEGKLDQSQLRQTSAPNEYAIVPYDGRSGTQRRPIYIECTESGYRFLPENVFIGANELKGGTPKFNALVTGTRALLRYWTLKHARDPKRFHRPYVLLLVRPGGIYAYDMARQLLSRLETNFGYELVEDEIVLQKLPPDEQSVSVLKEAIALAVEMGEKRTEESSPRTPDVQTWEEFRGESAGLTGGGRPGTGSPTDESRQGGRGSGSGLQAGNAASSTGAAPVQKGGPAGDRPVAAADTGEGAGTVAGRMSARSAGGPSGARGPGATPAGAGRARPAELGGGRRLEEDLSGAESVDGMDGNLGSGEVGGEGPPPRRLAPLNSGSGRGGRSGRGDALTGSEPNGSATTPGTGGEPREGLAGEPGGSGVPGTDGSGTAAPTGESADAAGREAGRKSSKLKEPLSIPAADAIGYAEINHGESAEGEGNPRKELVAEPSDKETGSRPPFPPEKLLNDGSGRPPSGMGGRRGPASNERAPIRKPDNESPPSIGAPGEPSLPGPRRPAAAGGGSRHLIGLERKIPIRVERNRVVVGTDDESIEIPIGKKMKSETLIAQVTGAMRQVVDSWGAPPPKFYWIPAVKFEVTTAGNPVYERLRGAFERQKVSSSVDYVDVADKPSRQEVR